MRSSKVVASNSKQLALFETVSDTDTKKVSLTESVSERQSAAIARFLGSSHQTIACITTYSPGRRKKEYYRLSFRLGRRIKHVHIRGGNANSELVLYRVEVLQAMIDRGAEIEELLAQLSTFNGVKPKGKRKNG